MKGEIAYWSYVKTSPTDAAVDKSCILLWFKLTCLLEL